MIDLTHDAVNGAEIAPESVDHAFRFEARGDAVYVPHCNGRERVLVDGVVKDPGSKGPLVIKLGGGGDQEHAVVVEVKASKYEKRMACGEAFRAGSVVSTKEGLTRFTFWSPRKGPYAGEAVVFVPKGHDVTKPSAMLVGVHPWNGTPWTYAAYKELLDEAQAKDVVLLMPSGLGNSLYTRQAENEVMAAIDAISGTIAIDKQRVSIWGASMGGAGATTIGFHHPDRFAFITSYFGDSKYDLTTYVSGILGGEAGAHEVNALDVLDNARHVPVWLIHGVDDKSSPVAQSEMLFEAMKKRGFKVDFDRVPGMEHEGPLVVKFIARVVDRAADARAPVHPTRVSFRAVKGAPLDAYDVHLMPAGDADAFADVERMPSDGAIHVHAAEGVRQIVLAPGALGGSGNDATVLEAGVKGVRVRWGL